MNRLTICFAAVALALLLLAGAAGAFAPGQVVYVTDQPRFVGLARVMAVRPDGWLVVNPWLNAPPGARNAWLVVPPAKCAEVAGKGKMP